MTLKYWADPFLLNHLGMDITTTHTVISLSSLYSSMFLLSEIERVAKVVSSLLHSSHRLLPGASLLLIYKTPAVLFGWRIRRA